MLWQSRDRALIKGTQSPLLLTVFNVLEAKLCALGSDLMNFD